MTTDFPRTEKEKKIYEFWKVRGLGGVTAVLGNLNVTLHQDNPRYQNLGVSYIYLEQFHDEAKEEGKKEERLRVAKELREAERDLHELVFRDTFPDGTKMTDGERTILKDAVTIAIERIEKVAKQLDGEKVKE